VRIIPRTALLLAIGVLTPAAANAQAPAASASPGAPAPPAASPAAPAAPAAAARPSPEVQAQAEAISAKAFDAYGKGDYAGALALYQQALQLAPAAALYFNVANIYDKKLPDPHLAIDFYRKCVSASDTTPELTLKATARIQALSQDLAPKTAAPKTAAPPKDEAAAGEDPGRSFRIAGGVILGVGAVGLGVGIGFGVDAKAKLDTANKSCTGAVCMNQAGVDAMNGANGSATASTAMFVTGGVLAATGIVLLAVAPSRKPAAAATGFRVAPALAPGHAGVALLGSF
jgi:tetratricopeptide (TPR) repeat protein